MHDDIRKVVDAITLNSPTSYTLDGSVREIDKIRLIDPYGGLGDRSSEPPADGVHPNYPAVLATDIYNGLYNKGSADTERVALTKSEFLATLSAANNGTGAWEDGWTCLRRDPQDGRLVVQRRGVMYWIEEQEAECDGEWVGGQPCRVRIPKEARWLNQCFYMAFGNRTTAEGPTAGRGLVRFYWNLSAAAAAPYIESITTALNVARLTFKTKVVSDPSGYVRCDAGVLYLYRDALPHALPCLLDVHRRIAPRLKPAVPLFCRVLRPGLGFAEDTGHTLSFGFSRAKIIADALVGCLAQQRTDKEHLLRSVSQAFEQQGIDPLAPFAARHHVDEYDRLLRNCHESD